MKLGVYIRSMLNVLTIIISPGVTEGFASRYSSCFLVVYGEIIAIWAWLLFGISHDYIRYRPAGAFAECTAL